MAVLLNPVPDGAWNRVRQNFGKLGRITLTYHSAVLSTVTSEISTVSAQLVTTDSELQVVSAAASEITVNALTGSYDSDYKTLLVE